MLRHVRIGVLAALGLLAVPLALATSSGVASAHERRTVGPYTFVVGFLVEPAIVDEPNGISLQITNTATGEPVTGAEQTLKAEATQGGTTKPFTLRARFGTPGGYTADLIPTKPGAYSFHFSGEINGTKVDEKFDSGPGRFNDVEDSAALEFPVQRAAASDSSAQITQLARQVSVLERSVQSANDQAASAQTVGIIGIVAGVLGVAVAAFALIRAHGEHKAQTPPSTAQ